MISFVWPGFMPFIKWAGGTEVYTLSHLKELQRMGVATRIVAYDKLATDSLAAYPDIPSLILSSKEELAELDDTLIFIMHPVAVQTKHQAYVILHVPIAGAAFDDRPIFANNGIGSALPIATSKFMVDYWDNILQLPQKPALVYPAVEKIFADVKRPERSDDTVRVLFAGRPVPEKGVYTLLASLHMPPLQHKNFKLTYVETMNNAGGADIVHALFKAHPDIITIPPHEDREGMASMYAQHDVVVMPSSSILWKEAFGMISVEAQHAGCRVVASDDGGLPETDCGGLILVKPDDPLALAEGIAKAIDLDALSASERRKACQSFTSRQSAEALLKAIDYK